MLMKTDRLVDVDTGHSTIPISTKLLDQIGEAVSWDPNAARWRIRKVLFTCVHPAEHTPDPLLVKEIQGFLPGFVPVWCIQEWRTPAGTDISYGFHVLGRWMETPQDPSLGAPLHITNFPDHFPFKGGYIYECRTWGLNIDPRGEEPVLFYPFTRDTVEWLRETWHFINAPGTMATKYFALAEAREAEVVRKLAQLDAEKKLAMMDDRYIIADCLENGRLFPDAPGTRPSVQLNRAADFTGSTDPSLNP